MNIATKPGRPFQKRKPSPIAAQATGSAETFVRFVVAKAIEQLERKRDAYAIACAKFPGDARLRTVIRATAEPPTSLANTPALAVMGTDFVESLQPISAAAQIFRASRLMLSFDTYAAISIPDLVGLDEGPPSWVAEGQPAPVGELSSQATVLEPYKLEFIVTVSRETLLGSNAEKLIGDALRTKIAFDMDKALFDALPADASRPAGLRSYNPRLSESTSTSNETAMMQDVAALVGAAESIGGGESLYLIGRTKRMMSMKQMYKILPSNVILLPSAASIALPDSVLLGVVPRAVPSAIGLPEVELVDSGAVVMDDAPGSPDMMAGGNVRSLFQSDTIGIKVRLPASWGLRHPAGANWITCIWPSDLGGGGSTGLPDAPVDGTYYGRHDGAWANVVEEITPAPALSGFVRWSFNPGNNAWYPVENLLAPYAPIDSPAFTGAPTAPHPPPFDDSNQLPTTAWTRATIATEGAGGLDDVPAAPNGAYARVRTNATASWQDFVTLGVAPLDNPQFTGIPRVTGPTPPVGVNSNVVATYEFVARDYLALSGGTLTGQLIAATGGVQTNVSLGFGDLQTGFYRTAGVLVCTVTGQAVVQFTPALSAFFGPVNFTNNVLSGVGDAVAAADALNLRTGDSRYLRSGGGPIIAPPGTSPTDVGLGVGDASTGLYRQGTSLAIAALGDVHMLFNSNRTAQVLWPLSMSGNVISNLATPLGALDAANKAYVDAVAARAPPFLFDIPVDYPLAADGAWKMLYAANFTIPARAVDTLVLVSLSLNFRDVNNIAILGARLTVADGATPERQAWVYGAPFPSLSSGVTLDLYATVRGVSPLITIELIPRAVSGAPNPFTVLGTDPATRSQFLIVDLGPVS